MVRIVMIALLIGIFHTTGYGQTSYIDSLRDVLKTTKRPVERFEMLDNLVLELNSAGNTVDSAATMEMLRIAQELNIDSLWAITYNWLGTYFYQNNGDNTTALDYYFKGIPYAKKAKDKRRISSLYFDIAVVYFDIQENELAFKMNEEGKENLPDPSHPLYNFMLVQYQGNNAQYYLLSGAADSAFYYATETEKTYRGFSDNLSYQFIGLTFLASGYALKKMHDEAHDYFGKALSLFAATDRPADWLLFYNNYIPFLLSAGQNHEAKMQSSNLLAIGTKTNNNNLKLAGAGYLRQTFDSLKQLDSAYYYSRMEAHLNTLIFSRTNKNKIQALAFSEQLSDYEDERQREAYRNKVIQYGLLSGLGVFLLAAYILYRNNRQKQKTNKVLETTLSDLKSTQTQLIQSEKMASLGELTAGIAHEIQNPLNFVNNFSEVSREIIDELKNDREKLSAAEQDEILNDLDSNLEKITTHGKRADAIVKGMLQHSRTSSGQKELTDINALCDEYLRLSFHGLRAKDKSFNAKFETELDRSLPQMMVAPQELGRVILNLINNAFYSVNQRKQNNEPAYEPTVTVSTKKTRDEVEIIVRDNGMGISQKVVDKIFQPFFTTKPTGQGTGLGLSLSYDIITKEHGGTLRVETKEGSGTSIIIQIPLARGEDKKSK